MIRKKMMVKVCGMTLQNQLIALDELTEIDFVGFIFYHNSPRFIDEKILESKKKKVGVFVNASIDEILQKIEKYKLSAIQLHGDETVQFVQEIRLSLPKEVTLIKAIGVDDQTNFKLLQPFESSIDYFLFDTKSKMYGGTGLTFDWNLLKAYTGSKPFLLSGGIQEKQLEQILLLDYPLLIGVDLNSGFELSPGVKNIERIKLVINQLKD